MSGRAAGRFLMERHFMDFFCAVAADSVVEPRFAMMYETADKVIIVLQVC